MCASQNLPHQTFVRSRFLAIVFSILQFLAFPTRNPQPVGCTAAAIKCRGLNDRNGAMAGARLQNVQARLGVLIDGRRETVTYGPRGTCSVAAGRQGLLREV